MSYLFVTGETIILNRGTTNKGCPRFREQEINRFYEATSHRGTRPHDVVAEVDAGCKKRGSKRKRLLRGISDMKNNVCQ